MSRMCSALAPYSNYGNGSWEEGHLGAVAFSRAWTSSDVRELKSLAKKKTGVAKISKALKRTIGATSVMAAKRGVSLDTRV